ncbi:unnamed protein product [Urochloa humidicola]
MDPLSDPLSSLHDMRAHQSSPSLTHLIFQSLRVRAPCSWCPVLDPSRGRSPLLAEEDVAGSDLTTSIPPLGSRSPVFAPCCRCYWPIESPPLSVRPSAAPYHHRAAATAGPLVRRAAAKRFVAALLILPRGGAHHGCPDDGGRIGEGWWHRLGGACLDLMAPATIKVVAATLVGGIEPRQLNGGGNGDEMVAVDMDKNSSSALPIQKLLPSPPGDCR